ncbi:MAG: hypothetical protein AAFX44_06580 [Pseudomonadota bacterium]
MKKTLVAIGLTLCSAGALADGCFVSGTVDQYIDFRAVDETDGFTPQTGLSSFTVVRARNGGADATYTTPTVTEIDAATFPGGYWLLLDEDMALDAGDDYQQVTLYITHSGMAPVQRSFCIARPKITVGETQTVASGVAESNTVQWLGSTPTALQNAADFRAEMDANSTRLAAINADSDEIQQNYFDHTSDDVEVGSFSAAGQTSLQTAVGALSIDGVPLDDLLAYLGARQLGNCDYNTGTRLIECKSLSDNTTVRWSMTLDATLDGNRGNPTLTPPP